MLSTNERNWILVKNQYEGYEYIDPNHQYTYPNSTVLINKQNVTKKQENISIDVDDIDVAAILMGRNQPSQHKC